MPSFDPIPPPPPSGARRALRVGLLVGLALVVVGGLAFAAASFVFLWRGEHANLPAGEAVEVVRYFFELKDEGEAEAVEADLDIALGAVRAAPAEEDALCRSEVDCSCARLRLRVEGEVGGGRAGVARSFGGEVVSRLGVLATRGNACRLYFPERVPVVVDLSFGAAEAALDFSGVALSRLAL